MRTTQKLFNAGKRNLPLTSAGSAVALTNPEPMHIIITLALLNKLLNREYAVSLLPM
jgi:hypothetical protein